MPRMTFNHEGYHNASDEEVEQLIADGWKVITEKEFQEVLHAKRKAAQPAPEVKPVAAKSQVKHGNSTNIN